MGALQFSTYDYLFLKHRSVLVKLLDVADEYYPSLKKATVHQMATENKFPFQCSSWIRKSYSAIFRELAGFGRCARQRASKRIKDFATFHQ